jgi:hypothetical protein
MSIFFVIQDETMNPSTLAKAKDVGQESILVKVKRQIILGRQPRSRRYAKPV